MNFETLIEKIMSRVRLIVSYCTVTASKNSDDGMTVDAEFVPGEKRTGLEFFQQFGFSSRPKGDVDGVALFIGGSRDNGVVIATRDASGQQLEEGEVVVYSAFGSSVKLKKDGTIALSPALLAFGAFLVIEKMSWLNRTCCAKENCWLRVMSSPG